MCCINIIYGVYTVRELSADQFTHRPNILCFWLTVCYPSFNANHISPCECIWNMFDKNWAMPLEFLTFISTVFPQFGMPKSMALPMLWGIPSVLPMLRHCGFYCSLSLPLQQQQQQQQISACIACWQFEWCQNYWFRRRMRYSGGDQREFSRLGFIVIWWLISARDDLISVVPTQDDKQWPFAC